MTVTHSTKPSDLPAWAQNATRDTLTVVWTPAVPQDLPLLTHFDVLGITPIKRAALLGQLTQSQPTWPWPARMAKPRPPVGSLPCSMPQKRVATPFLVASALAREAITSHGREPHGTLWKPTNLTAAFTTCIPPSQPSPTLSPTTWTSTAQEKRFEKLLSSLERKSKNPASPRWSHMDGQ